MRRNCKGGIEKQCSILQNDNCWKLLNYAVPIYVIAYIVIRLISDNLKALHN